MNYYNDHKTLALELVLFTVVEEVISIPTYIEIKKKKFCINLRSYNYYYFNNNNTVHHT